MRYGLGEGGVRAGWQAGWIAACVMALAGGCGSSSGPMPDAQAPLGDASQQVDGQAGDASRDATTPDASGDSGASEDANTATDADAARDAQGDAQRDATTPDTVPRSYVYVGGYVGSGAYPFRTYALNRQSLELTPVGEPVDLGRDPTFISANRAGDRLYVANEYGGDGAGVSVASIDTESGALTPLDHEAAPGEGLVFVALSPDERFVLAASYNGGYVAVYPVQGDGRLDPYQQRVDFGAGAQSHSVRVHPSGRWAFVPNKGLNSVAELSFDATTGQLAGDAEFNAPLGPRHLAFNADGSRTFLIQELSDTLRSLEADDDTGELEDVDSVPRLPASFEGTNYAGAHVLAHPQNDFVYASNREDSSVAAFRVMQNGDLQLIEHEPSGGTTPRNFDIDARGEIMVVANQVSGTVATFHIEANGSLTPSGHSVTGLPAPAAVAIVTFEDTP